MLSSGPYFFRLFSQDFKYVTNITVLRELIIRPVRHNR
jgi:hypothetical protein